MFTNLDKIKKPLFLENMDKYIKTLDIIARTNFIE